MGQREFKQATAHTSSSGRPFSTRLSGDCARFARQNTIRDMGMLEVVTVSSRRVEEAVFNVAKVGWSARSNA